MAALDGKELILGVTGSIAAYKAVYLLRELTALGARATVCLTEHAREFVGPLTFRTLSGRPVLTNLFDPQSSDAVEHVALAERAAARVESKQKKPTSVALEEISQAKVEYRVKEEGETKA